MRYSHLHCPSLLPIFSNRQTKFVDSSSNDTYAVYNPATDALVGNINLAREAEVDAAVTAARAAYETGEWSTYTASQRAAVLNKVADLMCLPENTAELTKAEVQAMGAPASIVSGFMVPFAADMYRYYAGWADKIEGQVYPPEGGAYRMTTYEPLGVCAGIGPWNVTLM